MSKNVTTICDEEIDVSKIQNLRFKQIIESYRGKDGFLFFGLFGSSGNYKEHWEYAERGFSIDEIEAGMQGKRHTDIPDHSEYSERHEDEYMNRQFEPPWKSH